MRRSSIVFLAVAGLLLLLLLGVRGTSALRAVVSAPPPAPVVVAGRDFSSGDATSSVPVGFASLRCTYEGEGDAGVLHATSQDDGTVVTGKTDAGTLRLDLAPGDWAITWSGKRKPQDMGTLSLAAGDLRTCKIGTKIALSGTVRSPEGHPVVGARVYGCGENVLVDDSGRFTVEVGAGRACNLHAEIQSGALSRISARILYAPFSPPPTLTFELDDRPVAGVGLALVQEEGAILIDDVLPDTPGAAAGLLPGDRITAVDGADIDGKAIDQVVALITGTAGTSVVLSVDRDDGPTRLTLTRAEIAVPKDTGG